jgi:hypothetical protein
MYRPQTQAEHNDGTYMMVCHGPTALAVATTTIHAQNRPKMTYKNPPDHPQISKNVQKTFMYTCQPQPVQITVHWRPRDGHDDYHCQLVPNERHGWP